jgi:hypothetical protein
MSTQSFSAHRVVVTFSLQRMLAEIIPVSWEEELERMVNRHIGDWGDMDQSDQELNDNALKGRASLFSAYHTSDGTQVWVITERERGYTMVLLPEDY